MAALEYVDVPGYAALLLRRTYDELEQEGSLIPLSKEWLFDVPRSVRPRWQDSRHLWTFPSGATIRFGHCQYEQDKYRYQSGGYQLVGFDELTHFTEAIYLYIGFSRRRRRMDLADVGIPTRVRAAAEEFPGEDPAACKRHAGNDLERSPRSACHKRDGALLMDYEKFFGSAARSGGSDTSSSRSPWAAPELRASGAVFRRSCRQDGL
jgi:hypothetical protein